MKKAIIIGGGTFSHVTSHLSLAAPAFGTTARYLHSIFPSGMDSELVLTKMADPASSIVTNRDLEDYVDTLISLNTTKIVFFNPAVCDFEGSVSGHQGKYSTRLKSSAPAIIDLTPADKIVGKIRKKRKDILVVAFKTTCGETRAEQFRQGLDMLKRNSVNLVVVNDVKTRENMIVTPEEGVYYGTREEVLNMAVEMAYLRSHLSFTRSTVIAGDTIPWVSDLVPANLRTVVDWLVSESAYHVFNGATTGHFAAKLGHGHFLTSIRKTNFNDIFTNGMVEVRTSGLDEVIAIGAKPSVGGQSQRVIFDATDLDCIVHFHCPLLEGSKVPVVSQREYECGSLQCGINTRDGLKKFEHCLAVMLDMHGPNIVFSKDTDPADIIEFIRLNFDLSKPTNGFSEVYL
jgi:hypothetical protein